ncbi:MULTISPECIES: amidohydrolase family protein [Croceitalea]|uniref:Amidohydrolase family protein n=1 Tax=Croceitalea vernalis TaxID=3075599 RepID=A0ABU3BKP0_9FLAO|nr:MULTISPECIES: amidohydrolase family protein [unclassified Croceitalea]MDT0540759.1 amidohydrolase family protein [Croceitalea sp. P059]MDT0622738.1 amidohydrolase family protein [Croceitalea sp. P007]
MKKLNIVLAILWGFALIGQQTPADKQSEPITIEGAVAHLGNGKVIENSLIMFVDGKITFVGDAKMKIARIGKVINAKGKHVYPGFIAPGKSLGLVEVNAVRASDDQDEIGDIIPHIRSLIAYNAESQVVESMRPNGVLLSQITPQGGRISGTSSIVQFDAWNWEDAAVKVDDGIHLNWPNTFRRGRWWMGEPRGYQPNKNYQKDVDEVKSFMGNSVAYGKTIAKESNQPFEAMQGLFDGTQKLYIYAHGQREIMDAVTSAKDAGVKHVVLVGGYHAHKVTDFLKENDIPVLVRFTHTLPFFEDDDYDFTFKLPKILVDAGLLVGLQNSDASNFQTRNLPFYAGQVVAQGLDRETALQLISSNNAKILGIDANYGSLEVGKSATLFISEGDALDMRTNQLSKAYIDGRDLSLETHQTELWKRYMGKFEGK